MHSLFDTHAHLNACDTFPDYPCLNVTTKPEEWGDALDIYRDYPCMYPALGIHPWFVQSNSEDQLLRLSHLLAQRKSYAIGEIGLDFGVKYKINRREQLRVFDAQLVLACEFNLPVSIHVNKAHNDMLRTLKDHVLPKCGVIHGLGGSREVISSYIELGYKIGVNAVACRSNARRYHDMLSYFSLDCFVLESDYPNVIAPSRSCATLDSIHLVASLISNIKEVDLELVYNATFQNASEVFLNDGSIRTTTRT